MRPEARDIDALLSDLVEWGMRIRSYVAEMPRERFFTETLVQDAVIRCFEVMGEAARTILKADDLFQVRHPILALKEAYRARNRTSHGDGSLDMITVWEAATVAAPKMVEAAARVLEVRQRDDLP